MTFSVTPYGDNPFVPGASGYSYNPDQLIAGDLKLVTHNVTMTGGAVYPRGTIIGRQTNSTVVVKPGSNTGNGTVGSVAPGTSVETAGSYALLATSATTFTVTDPEGTALPNATVGSAYSQGEIAFTITAGSTAFAAGDSFALTYNPGVGTCVPCVKTANDGSQTPVAVLADTVDTTGGPAIVGAYFMGEFNSRAVTYDNSWALTDLTVALQPRSIHLKGSVSAADPT